MLLIRCIVSQMDVQILSLCLNLKPINSYSMAVTTLWQHFLGLENLSWRCGALSVTA
jgi:hypothetical protein